MGSSSEKIHGKTLEELKKKVDQWFKEGRAHGFGEISAGWDPQRVVKTKDGFEIFVRARFGKP